MTDSAFPQSLDAELQQLTTRLLSPTARYAHVALLLAALGMSVLLGALLATEPDLPDATRAALAVMLGIGASWVVYALWVLRHRRPLFARHRVVAGWMAVVFTSLFAAGALAMAIASGGGAFYAAAATAGGGMLTLAIVLLVQAYRQFARLQRRRLELEGKLRAHG
jgi:hypothetical protein